MKDSNGAQPLVAARPEAGVAGESPPPSVVALSGPDNTGKTTQLRILSRRLGTGGCDAGPLDGYDPRWPSIRRRPGGMAAWWFHDALLGEIADVLASSYLERSRTAAEGPVRLVDRGVAMLEATVAATAAVREQLGDAAAAERAHALLAPYAADLAAAEAAEYGIVLLAEDEPGAGARRSLSREARTTPVYADYQRRLHVQMHRMAAEGRWAHTIVVGRRPVASVQDAMRQHLHAVAPTVPTGMLNGVDVCALGGMSESGKSTAGEYLRLHHGYARLKIGYLIEDAAERSSIAAPYAQPAEIRAELLLDGLDRYCAAHHFLTRITLESLHDRDAIAALQRLLGAQLNVAYIDTQAQLRAARGTAGPRDVVERDAVKTRRGAPAIAELADDVVDNNRSRLHLKRRLDRIALRSRWAPRRPALAPVSALGLPEHLESYLNSLLERAAEDQPLIELLAVTGSGARGKYQDGWSDLDVFVIAASTAVPALRSVLADLQAGLGGVKLGLTVVSSDECRTGALTPRLLRVLAQLGTGELTAQWCRPGLTLPAPERGDVAVASIDDGVVAAVEIRRQLLKSAPDPRSLYKLAGLLAKVLLRFDGIEQAGDGEALAVVLQRAHRNVPDACSRARQDPRAAAEVAEQVLGQWTATLAPEADR